MINCTFTNIKMIIGPLSNHIDLNIAKHLGGLKLKFGYRTPSFKKSFKARTTGSYKRAAKRAINPYYGRKGTGWINNPKKAAYNKVYHQTTRSIFDEPKATKQAPKKLVGSRSAKRIKQGKLQGTPRRIAFALSGFVIILLMFSGGISVFIGIILVLLCLYEVFTS